MHGTLAALDVSSCPRCAPGCSLQGSGELVVSGKLGMQSRVGSHPLRVSLPTPFHGAWPCPAAQRDGGKVEGERLTSQPSQLLFCGLVLIYVCAFECVYSLDGDSEIKHALWIM